MARKFSRPRRFAALAAVLLASATAAAGAAGGATAQPTGPTLLESLPGSWYADDGKPVNLRSLAGQRLVVTMAYADCHRVCPMTIGHLQALQAALDASGSRATFVVVGYDPGIDDPAAWHNYRSQRGLTRPNWLFLAAPSASQVREFAGRLGFEFWKYDEHVMHDERVVVIDPQGNLQLSFGPGAPLDARAIAADRPSKEPRGT